MKYPIDDKQSWSTYLKDFEVKSILPIDYQSYHKTEKVLNFQTYSFKLNEKLFNKETDFEVLLYSAWALLLQRYNNREDVLFGTVSKNGSYLPMSVKYDSKLTLSSFLQTIKNNIEEREYFDELIEEILIHDELYKADLLFDSLVSVLNTESNPVGMKFILEVNPKNPISLNIIYDSNLFKATTIKRMSEHLSIICEQILELPQTKVGNIEIMTVEEKNQVLNGFNSQTVEYNRTLTVDQFFEMQVEKNPNAVAVVCGDRQLTYKELNEKSNQLARRLRLQGVGPEIVVGLIIERDIELIIGMLGIIKAGGAYLPVDPLFPIGRINYMFKKGNVPMLLTNNSIGIVLDYNCKYIYLDESSIFEGDTSNLSKLHTPQNLMYTLYTSGSTGEPKGVAVEHRNVTGYVHAFIHEFNITSNDRMIQQSTVSFDISVEEIFPILFVGGTLIIAKRHEVSEIPKLIEVMDKNKATMISGFPLLLNELNNYPIPTNMHTMISGGDVLREEYVTNLKNQVRIYNTYGPSETTVCINYFEYNDDSCESSIPTGKTIANYKVYILDKNKEPMPIGVPGEIFIGGVGVSREYHNRPDITTERYMLDPFQNNEGKMFKSSDLAKWLPDGNIIFLGRLDNQVKIRGRRTEPDEIQRILIKHKAVKEAFVLARIDKYNHKYLTAYVVGEDLLSAVELKKYLAEILPDFMIPSYFVQLDKIPLTINGKVNTKDLPVVID
ncbi:non-ribosomal peptide synthetase [Viridibacillus sp. NPDC096237]|uniref:non-ribosomal peptide synthetase n=1 Tax=Viridibacillus sp. NPDC096237 TaxID=3390721 RepID=UPI003D04B41A